MLALWLAAKNWRDEQFALSFSTAVVAALLASYHLYTYDLSLLVLPISIVCGESAQHGRALPVLLIVALAVLFVPPLHLWLIVRGLYAIMFVPIAILFSTMIWMNRSGAGQVSIPIAD